MVNNKYQKSVAVLMATHNGMNWLDEQIESILNQINVEVTIFISDDNSVDGTFDYLCKLEKKNQQIVLLPKIEPFGSAAKNFYHLISEVNFKGFNYISLSDQDDIWNKDKLFTHITILEKNNAAAVSSNVIAFWPSGLEVLIEKSQPQRKYDFLFEGPGPGCTFLITPWLVSKVKYQLKNNKIASHVELHDWLIYAICCAYKKLWIIDSRPSLKYRQHSTNVLGANFGLRALFTRLKRIFNGWYRNQVSLIYDVFCTIAPSKKINEFRHSIRRKSINGQIKLISFAFQGRRKLIDRLALVLSILLFIF